MWPLTAATCAELRMAKLNRTSRHWPLAARLDFRTLPERLRDVRAPEASGPIKNPGSGSCWILRCGSMLVARSIERAGEHTTLKHA